MSAPSELPAGRIVYDEGRAGLSEHGVHHFHGLLLDAYRAAVPADRPAPVEVGAR